MEELSRITTGLPCLSAQPAWLCRVPRRHEIEVRAVFYQPHRKSVALAFAGEESIPQVRMHVLVSRRLAAVDQSVMRGDAAPNLAFYNDPRDPASVRVCVAD